jgi:hypothetical protein
MSVVAYDLTAELSRLSVQNISSDQGNGQLMTEVVITAPRPDVFDLTDRINAIGYAVVESFVPLADLRNAQEFVGQAVAKNGGEYIAFVGCQNLGGTFLERLPADPSFVELCRGIYVRAMGTPAPNVGFYQILRCLSGSETKRHSMRFHYDSYILTALIPIVIPSHGKKGKLIIVPNMRQIRRSYAANVFDKVLVDNPLSQSALRIAYTRQFGSMIKIELKPGNLYFFWGYRSLHTNEPCDPDEIRSTALLHYADPHADSSLKRMLRAA